MSFTDNSAPVLQTHDGAYQRQMTSYRRTRSAILEGAKSLVVLHGVAKTTMIEIADAAQVSRATLYNHFRDKGSVLRALLESEVERILGLASSAPSSRSALEVLSHQISSDPALATMRKMDPAIVSDIATATSDPIWQAAHEAVLTLVGVPELGEIAILWLVGQIFNPIEPAASQAHALHLANMSAH